MAKNIIEKVPFEFKFGLYDIFKIEDGKYYHTYKEVDEKGRYLYWDKIKYHAKLNKDDPLIAWYSVKLHRASNKKWVKLQNKDNILFQYAAYDSLQSKLYKISEFSRDGLMPTNPIGNKYLFSSLVIEEAINSSQLEGASTTRRVAKEMIASAREAKSPDERMIVNNYLLMKEVKRAKANFLSIDMILQFHEIATQGLTENGVIPGQIRTNDDIFIGDIDGNNIYQPPKYDEVLSRLEMLCVFANENHEDVDFIHPVIKAIILHFMIGYIHPFSDGNGRTARALFYWFMMKNGYDYFEYISISKLLKAAPVKYSKAYLYTEIDDNDLNYFIYYQIDIILRAIDDLRSFLEKKSEEFLELTEILKNSELAIKLNFVQKDIIKKAIKSPGRIFTALEVSVDYDVSANTARTYLKNLVSYKILGNYKDGRTIAYISPANLHELLKKQNK
ncbi:MAG: Fic family protein [Sulfurovum sp.]|nr:Fic family protein [Sulfurovum sp.]